MAGYSPRSIFPCILVDLDFVSVQKNSEKELGQYPAILTSRLVNYAYVLIIRALNIMIGSRLASWPPFHLSSHWPKENFILLVYQIPIGLPCFYYRLINQDYEHYNPMLSQFSAELLLTAYQPYTIETHWRSNTSDFFPSKHKPTLYREESLDIMFYS